MDRSRLDLPGAYYVGLFDAAGVRLYPGEAEVTIILDNDELTVAVPLDDGAPDGEAMAAARSVLAQLGELDRHAARFLFSLDGWPYGEDALLWLLIVERDNARFCYRQESVNDEQVVGFRREEGGWALIGLDPRFRGEPPAP
jgi:hypothetical protein